MAVSVTNNANADAVAVRNGATRVKKVEIYQRSAAAPVLFLQLFNTNSATPGTTAPEGSVIRIPPGQTGKQAKQSIVFASERGGLYLNTGLSYCVTTTHDGSTSPSSADRPQVKIHWCEA